MAKSPVSSFSFLFSFPLQDGNLLSQTSWSLPQTHKPLSLQCYDHKHLPKHLGQEVLQPTSRMYVLKLGGNFWQNLSYNLLQTDLFLTDFFLSLQTTGVQDVLWLFQFLPSLVNLHAQHAFWPFPLTFAALKIYKIQMFHQFFLTK